jgi:hypothetical protein
MKRFKVLFGQRRVMVLVTLTILVLAAAALAASSASFTAQTANPGNIFTAGSLSMSNDKAAVGTGAIVTTAGNMKPGDTVSGTVTLQNTGTVSGAFTLSKTLIGSDAIAFGAKLQMTIQEYTDNTFATPVTGAPLYSGAASGAITNLTLGTWAPSATHYYKVSVNWPTSGGAADNTFMTASVTYRFQWDATSL